MSFVSGIFNYLVVVFLMMAGFYVVIAHENLIKKLVGVSIFQTSVFFFYISMGKISGATPPILDDRFQLYSNPLPHVLILTAIVVGIATTRETICREITPAQPHTEIALAHRAGKLAGVRAVASAFD